MVRSAENRLKLAAIRPSEQLAAPQDGGVFLVKLAFFDFALHENYSKTACPNTQALFLLYFSATGNCIKSSVFVPRVLPLQLIERLTGMLWNRTPGMP